MCTDTTIQHKIANVSAVIMLLANITVTVIFLTKIHKISLTVTTCDATLHQRQLLKGYLVNLKYDRQQGSAEHALVLNMDGKIEGTQPTLL